ncbi:MFS transporter [Niastella yeongjuensis]|uniref:MFS transporter n=1 Tax=Niastella yeongjuensis TaxID=354355 RepID=A0A1V9EMN7_9BACT|nr:MFS transporter [Niastella yeongjuensis]OQP47408.1 MFS transporter [Niastella yeongjuensis]SEN82622.1 Major Facilitator Superfamily protein [Niastella yeongjuensis]
MKLLPSDQLTNNQVKSGLHLILKDGLATETMNTLTAGTFLVAIALYMGASNVQIGVLAALPTFTNIFQLVSVWLVQRFNNRRAITVTAAICARIPLLVIGIIPLLFSDIASVSALIFLLSFQCLFASIAGGSWNSWMRDLIPQQILGSYFSHRSRLMQILNVTLSLFIAMGVDYIKAHYPAHEITAYAGMFIFSGIAGMWGVYALARTPEPKSKPIQDNIVKLFSKPLTVHNFRKLLVFNSCWIFAFNLVTPFFSVYMMKTLGLPLFYVITLNIVSQVSSITSIKLWGRCSDRFSNKTIIRICAPVYIGCVMLWSVVGAMSPIVLLPLLVIMHVLMGASNAGITLALQNIGLKLAPADEGIVYLVTKNIVTAVFSATAPLAGGLLADFFTSHFVIHLFGRGQWNLLFMSGAAVGLLSMKLLKTVQENGELDKRLLVTELQHNFKKQLRNWHHMPLLRRWFYLRTAIVLKKGLSLEFDDLIQFKGYKERQQNIEPIRQQNS